MVSLTILHRIHKALLHLVENQNADSQHNEHNDKAVSQPTPTDEFASTQSAILEGLDDGSDRVEVHEFV